MQVDLITETHSDLTVVNAARISSDKESSWHESIVECPVSYDSHIIDDTYQICSECHCIKGLSAADSKLINYLAKHNHWTPFAHPQEIFEFSISYENMLRFLLKSNLSGFEWSDPSSSWRIRGSLYAWLTNIQWLPEPIANSIWTILDTKYPVSTKAILGEIVHRDIKQVININPSWDGLSHKLEHYTLRIHCPIFVKGQLETHLRNLVMTDISDFSQNEVSKRYVDTEPEIYHPDTWRLQAKDKKQGSVDGLDRLGIEAILIDSNYAHHTHNAMIYYNKFNELNIAYEQSRMILPQSTYTTFWWTGSLKSFRKIFELRLKPDTREETKVVVQAMYDLIKL